MQLRRYLQDVIEKKQRGIFPYILQRVFSLASRIWGFVVHLRNLLYDHHIFSSYKSPIFTISIGNIVAGGTGKTPLTLMLANYLKQHGPVAIATRGYLSSVEHKSTSLLAKPEHSWQIIGDEARLFMKKAPDCKVFVGKNRIDSAKQAEKLGISYLILDDGMQHRQLNRDLDVIVLNGHDPFGRSKYLPYGFLRESKRQLKRADLIIINHFQDALLFAKIRKYTSVPIVGMKPIFCVLKDPAGNSVDFPKKAALFCGIAHPQNFVNSVQEMGCEVTSLLANADHRSIDKHKLKRFAKEAKKREAQALICTEKDFVKLSNLVQLDLPIYVFEMELTCIYGKEHWDGFLQEKIIQSASREKEQMRDTYA